MQILEFGPAWPEKSGGPLTFSFHGFPAIRSQQNRVIAERLSQKLNRRVEAPLYSGLGIAPGLFRFHTCLEEVRTYIVQRLEAAPNDQRDLDFVGHSWGGYLALALSQTETIARRLRRVVLMSPLLRFNVGEPIRRELVTVAQENAVNFGDLDELASDYANLGLGQPAATFAEKMPREVDVFLLQAADDTITPPDVAEEVVKKFARAPRFEIADNDHGFTRDRLAVADHIAEFLL